jgi:hypothetical protein
MVIGDRSRAVAKLYAAPAAGVCMAWRFRIMDGEAVSSQVSLSSACSGLRRQRKDMVLSAREDSVALEAPSMLLAGASATVRN